MLTSWQENFYPNDIYDMCIINYIRGIHELMYYKDDIKKIIERLIIYNIIPDLEQRIDFIFNMYNQQFIDKKIIFGSFLEELFTNNDQYSINNIDPCKIIIANTINEIIMDPRLELLNSITWNGTYFIFNQDIVLPITENMKCGDIISNSNYLDVIISTYELFNDSFQIGKYFMYINTNYKITNVISKPLYKIDNAKTILELFREIPNVKYEISKYFTVDELLVIGPIKLLGNIVQFDIPMNSVLDAETCACIIELRSELIKAINLITSYRLHNY